MLPITIVCHADCTESAYLCNYFDNNNIVYKKINGINDDLALLDLAAVSGLVIMGGHYSVNDDHIWITDEIKFLQRAIKNNTPLMGVCFGAQLVSKALGAEISTAKNMEAGWHTIKADTSKLTDSHDLKLDECFDVFEWHEDTFSIPDGAIPIFSGRNIENQGYLYGKVLAMQFHLEMTERMVHEWLTLYCDCMPKASQHVQSPEQIIQHLDQRLDDLHAVADKIYGWWLGMVKQ